MNKLAYVSMKGWDDLQIDTNKKLQEKTDYNEPDSALSVTRNYISAENSNNFYTPYLPFISNCDGLGAFIPLWELFSYRDLNNQKNSCKLKESFETRAINYFVPKDSDSDECHLKFSCIYDERLLQRSVLYNKQWIYAPTTTQPVFRISKTPVTQEQFIHSIGDYYEDMESLEWVAFKATKNKEPVVGNYVPRVVNITMFYYQYDIYTKRISIAKINFSQLEKWTADHDLPKNKKYTFYFDLVPWSWYECMNNFMFPILWYLVILFFAVLLFLVTFIFINMFARRTSVSGIPAEYSPKLSIRLGLDSLMGVFIVMMPFLLPILLFKNFFPYLNFGPSLIDKITDPSLNRGRLGGSLIALSICGIFFSSSMITPKITHVDKNLKGYTDHEISEMQNKLSSQQKAFAICIILFSTILSVEYITVSYIVSKIDKIYESLAPLQVTLIQVGSIQVLFNVIINGNMMKIFEATFMEPLFVLPFRLLTIVKLI